MRAPSRFVPGPRLAFVSLLPVPLLLFEGGALGFALLVAVDGLLLGLALMESRALARALPTVERSLPARLSVGEKNEVRLLFHNPSSRTVRLVVREHCPDGWNAEPDELRVVLPPWARRTETYVVRPPRRGRFRFQGVHMRLEGWARLGSALAEQPAAVDARVYPNVLGPRRYDLAARLGDLNHVGVRNIRVTGGGGEFEQLREYVRGDPPRDFDWKSTAKRHRPVTRVYQQERSQSVLLCLDVGRMMAARLESLTKLDHTINASLLLAYVALRKGDRVGLVVFSDVVHAFVPPARGPVQYRRLLEALYSVQADETFVDFRRLVEFIRLRVPRRSLLLLMSDLLDEAHARPLADNAAILRKKHLPVCVTMNDPVAIRLADEPAHTEADVFQRAAAADILAEREAVKARLTKQAVGLVEAPASELAIATVNRYLELKARHRL